MFKAVAMIKRKKGMSMEDFINYYESKHAPLAVSRVPNLKKYIRHYLTPYGNNVYAANNEPPFDVITEIWFNDREDFELGMKYLTEPETAKIIGKDEENLFDKSSIRFMTMEEYETDFSAFNS